MAPTTKTLAIAFGGVEEVSTEVVTAELDDLFKANGEPDDVVLVLPFSKEDTNLDFPAVGEWAKQYDPPFEVRLVSDGTLNPARAPKEVQNLVALAGDSIETNPEWWTAAVETLDELREKNGADVLVVVSCTEEQLGENDAHVMDLVEAADKSRIPVKAINAGMEDVQVGEPSDDAPVAEPEPEPQPTRRRRAVESTPDVASVPEPVAETPAAPTLPLPRRRRGADEGQQVQQESSGTLTSTNPSVVTTSTLPGNANVTYVPSSNGSVDNSLARALDVFADLVADKLAARLGK